MRPTDESELAEAVRSGHGRLTIRGGGTRRPWPVTGRVLDTGAITGIVTYEPGALTLVVRAGTSLAEIETLLRGEGQHLPFEPPDLRGLLGRTGEPTIGGVAAANASGPRRVQAGACRDYLLGIRLVDGTGTVVRNGGRVMKNVTGYDLVKLAAGSNGSLGVLTEIALKILPRPETVATLVIEGLDDAAAVQAMARALGSPYEVSGAAHWPGQGTFLRVEGFSSQVSYRARQLQRILGGEIEADAARWPSIRDVAPFRQAPGDVWRLSVKPTEAPAIVARAGAEAALYDWGGGLVWLRMAEGTDLRARLGPFSGHATLVRAAPDTLARLGVFHPEAPGVAALARGLRTRFDPRGLFNPGLPG
ncbi:MAG: FAD-binding protein [Gemmobacter sp.]